MEPREISPTTRAIWSNIENILLIYVGSAADFALNSEVDWLFFTNQLPSDPQRRFVETFRYQQKLFFADSTTLPRLLNGIRRIHTHVEETRTRSENTPRQMSNRAFVEVHDMLIEYGIRGYEYIHHRPLLAVEREAYFQDMEWLIRGMGVELTDATYADFQQRRAQSIQHDLQPNAYTAKLYAAYRNDIGPWRYWILRQFQAYFVHPRVAKKLGLGRAPLFALPYRLYPYLRQRWILRLLLRIFVKKHVRHILYSFEQPQATPA